MTNALTTSSGNSAMTPGPADVAAFTGGNSAIQKYLDNKYNYQATMNPEQQRILAQQKQYEGGLPEMSFGTMFPSAGIPIQKGTYGGSVVGNVPLFAPSMLTPFGVFDAKQRAMQDAAAKKAQEIDAFYKMAAPPQTKRVAVQGELNDEFYRGLQMWQDNAKAAYGDDWTTALRNDTGFNGWLNSMTTVARYEDSIVDQVAKLQELENDTELVLSQNALNASSAFINGVGGLSNPFDPAGHNLGSYLMSAQAETNLDVAVNDAVKEFANDTASSMGKYGEEGVYDVWAEWSTKGMTDKQVNDIADGIWKDQYGGQSDIFTIDDIRARVRSLYPRVTQTKLAGTPSTRQPASSDGSTQKYTSDWNRPSEFNTGWSSASGIPASISPTTAIGGVSHVAPIQTSIVKGQKLVNNETGAPAKVADGTIVTWGETRIVPTTKEGVIIPDSEVEWYKKNAPNSIQYSVVSTGTYEDVGADGAPKKVTVYTQSSSIKTSLVKKEVNGTTELGVPVAEMQKRADELNKEGTFSTNVEAAKRRESYGQNQPAPFTTYEQQRSASENSVPSGTQSNNKPVEAPYFTNPTEEQYNSLPLGAKYMYNGVEYTKE